MRKDAEKDIENTSITGIQKYLLQIILMAAVLFLVFFFVATTAKVHGKSMEPTLQENNILLVDKVSYRFSKPDRYDVVIVDAKQKNYLIVKRIVGLPGETLQIINGVLYINGQPMDSDIYGKETMRYAGIAAQPITLQDGEYFMLGDNRNDSDDSRYEDVGVIPKQNIYGRVLCRIFPHPVKL